jgi:hypothetical protein
MTHLEAIKKKIQDNLKRQKEIARATSVPMPRLRFVSFQLRPLSPRARRRRDALHLLLETSL